jgi:hypothetical protein
MLATVGELLGREPAGIGANSNICVIIRGWFEGTSPSRALESATNAVSMRLRDRLHRLRHNWRLEENHSA